MSKSIRSYPPSTRDEVIERRLKNPVKGLGYWAAKDALAPVGLIVSNKSKAKQVKPQVLT